MTASHSEATVRHTRGPWRVIDDVDLDTKQRNRLHQIWSAEEPIIYPDGRPGTSSILIARTCFAPNSEANARLIAAAPDMYEALTGGQEAPESLRPIQWAWGLLQDYEEMLRRHESQHPDPDAAWEHVSRVRRMLTLLEAALAKAEGREASANG